MLFRQGNPRDISQLTDLEYQYVCAVAKDLYQATCVLQTTWEGAKSGTRYKETLNYLNTHNKLQDDGNVSSEGLSYKDFGGLFKNTPSTDYSSNLDATIQIIEGARDIIGEVAGSKIGLPWSGQDDSYIESPYARNSIVDFYDNIAARVRCMERSMPPRPTTSRSSTSVSILATPRSRARHRPYRARWTRPSTTSRP